MPIKTIPEWADNLDHMLFNCANRLERLAEMTGDKSLQEASRIVGGQRPRVRRHMDAVRRRETEAI